MCVDGRCVLCNRGEVEDVGHFVLNCEECNCREGEVG